LAVLLFALLAVPLGFAVGQSLSFAASTVSGIIILATYYTARTTAEMLAGSGIAWAAASSWMILAIFTCYGIWQLHRVPR
jgi:lipopolysaccharide export LptBFGC system permease protein LptF